MRAATRLLEVQSGQSGQPRPDALSRTAAPVMMIPAFATTPASATRRIEVGVGKRKGAAQARTPRPALVRLGAGPVVPGPVVPDLGGGGPGGGGPGGGGSGGGGPGDVRAEIGWHGPHGRSVLSGCAPGGPGYLTP